MKAIEAMNRDLADQARLHDYMERFTKRWAPTEHEANAAFQADFLLVIQAVHRDAMKPIEKVLTSALSVIPPLSIIPQEKSK